ncbi:DUF1109 domain-containing protein [Kosakonia sp. ML.JS2a]|uniref:DUF1109 domain-containing protein n=1 Tax=Kosakonia sp. ML.JS2a TaxID=2980557 RepID=UPI0021DAA973|nr:DUF1109 domain-containing protein [Kosakonia sp. ML.JS2a]UXY12021.1 DUF1109 domain-containing protein [Kosakonia sp. ML.JS2a]
MADHDVLIEKLSRSMEPVKRPWQPGWRTLAWVAMALPCGIIASLLLNRTLTDWSQTGANWAAVQLLLTFVAGLLAVRNAFLLSIAGQRPLNWRWFAPLAGLWLISTLANLHSHHGAPAVGAIEGPNCYLFMVVVSTPMVAMVIGYLRRTRTLYPLRSLAAAGAGVACMALTLLSLCHPTHISALDLLMHIAATATIVTVTIVVGYRWVSLP